MERFAWGRLLQQRVVGQRCLTCLTPGGQRAVSDWIGAESIPINRSATRTATMPQCRHGRPAHAAWCHIGQEGRARPFHRRAGVFDRAAVASDGATERWGARSGDTLRLWLCGARDEPPRHVEGDGSRSHQGFLKIGAGSAPAFRAEIAEFHSGNLVTSHTLWRSYDLAIDAWNARELAVTQFWDNRAVTLQGDDPMVQFCREAPLDGRSQHDHRHSRLDHRVLSFPHSPGGAQRWKYTQSYVTQQARNS